MEKLNFKAVLFDFDGVLAETMQDNFNAWKKAFQVYNQEITPEDYFHLEGMKVVDVAKTIAEKYRLNINPEETVELKKRYYLENNSFRFYSGVEDLVDRLRKAGKRLAIVTASPRTRLEKTVPQQFLDNFQAVISGDDYEKGKPSPEPYLIAMKKLEVSPEECIVVENAPLGVESAKASGAYCIALTTTLSREYLQKADQIVINHTILEEKLFNN